MFPFESGALAAGGYQPDPMQAIQGNTARLATLDEILAKVIPLFVAPVPARETVRGWLDDGSVPRFKSNPTARRGGGPCFYSLAAVEKLLRGRTLPKMGGPKVRRVG